MSEIDLLTEDLDRIKADLKMFTMMHTDLTDIDKYSIRRACLYLDTAIAILDGLTLNTL